MAMHGPVLADKCEVWGHRGNCFDLPENTGESFENTFKGGAHGFEVDVVFANGIPVIHHGFALGDTTDALKRFPGLITTKTIDEGAIGGGTFTDVFVNDLNVEQFKQLVPKQRFSYRNQNHGCCTLLTLDELLIWLKYKRLERPSFKVDLEIKHYTEFTRMGIDVAGSIIAALEKHGMYGDENTIVSAFEPAFLIEMHSKGVPNPKYQLLESELNSRPYDFITGQGPHSNWTIADLITEDGLQWITSYADGLAPHKPLILQKPFGEPSFLVKWAQKKNIPLMTWTFRSESLWIPEGYHDLAQEVGDLLRQEGPLVRTLLFDNPKQGLAIVKNL